MDLDMFSSDTNPIPKLHTVRDVLTIAFRRRRLLVVCVLASIVCAGLGAWLLPRYKGEGKLFISHQRLDPAVTPAQEQSSFTISTMPPVTDEELRSEVELLTSYDLERQVLRTAHPERAKRKNPFAVLSAWKKWFTTPEERESAAVQKLDHDLNVDVIKGTNMILVEYKNSDPEVAKRVLDTLVQAYLASHTAVHAKAGQLDFFEQQATQYKRHLDRAEAQLSDFSRKYKAVNPAQDRDMTLQKLNEFRFSLHNVDAEMADAKDRIQNLQQQLGETSDRITTQLKRSDNPELMQQLKGTLLNLELKRIELLGKFQPDYRPVQEVERQIVDTRAAIQDQEKAPVQEATTDVDPTHLWITGELAKAKAELAGLDARQAALQRTIGVYEAAARQLDQKAIIHHDLQRDAESEENKYLMYVRKREEARVTSALNKEGVLNVAVAEPPIVPALPSHSPFLFAAVIFSFMTMLSCCIFWALEHFDSTLRSTSEIEALLRIPVLAAVPHQNGNSHRNGFHNGNGNNGSAVGKIPHTDVFKFS